MKMDDAATLQPSTASTVSPEVYQQIGSITRLVHDTLAQLGVMPKLQLATEGLPDARSRLSYIASKTAEAAEKVLNSVDRAKADHAHIAEAANRMAALIVADPVKAVASGATVEGGCRVTGSSIFMLFAPSCVGQAVATSFCMILATFSSSVAFVNGLTM